MAKFITELDAHLKAGREDVWVLNTPLVFVSDLVGRIEAKTRFETDLASVPRVPIIYAMWGAKAHREAVIHDFLFRSDSAPVAGFWRANRVFLEAMKVRGKPWYIRYPMYYGVCAGSALCYHKRKVDDKL